MPCTFHPERDTLIACTRCRRAACPDCLVPAPVEMQCRACVKGVPVDRALTGKAATKLRGRAATPTSVTNKRPGPVFYGLVAAFAASCVVLYVAAGALAADSGWLKVAALAVVLLGAVVSVTLHEWGHAVVAYHGGDYSVIGKGYLRMDPRKYSHPLLSVGMPVVFLLMGGMPLPGGAVWIEDHLLRSRRWRTAVSLAGVSLNLAFALLMSILAVLVVEVGTSDIEYLDDIGAGRLALASCLSFLALLQVAVALLNLLPIPGLDGYAALEPHLPPAVTRLGDIIRPYGLILVFLVVLRSPVAGWIWEAAFWVSTFMGVDPGMVGMGYDLANPNLFSPLG